VKGGRSQALWAREGRERVGKGGQNTEEGGREQCGGGDRPPSMLILASGGGSIWELTGRVVWMHESVALVRSKEGRPVEKKWAQSEGFSLRGGVCVWRESQREKKKLRDLVKKRKNTVHV